MEDVNPVLDGFADELGKLAADLTPSQPVMTDQRSFGGISGQVTSSQGAKKILPGTIGHMATRAGSPPPRTTPPNMLREAR